MTGELYYGDNLAVLRASVRDGSVDLIYLDPPFNSNANYNVLFRSPTGARSDAQVQAFEDTWHWGEEAELAYDEVMRSGTGAAGIVRALRGSLGENDMMAYLVMMAVRLIELHRVLKRTGSLYLHCDPTASHYLKILLDAIFKPWNFRSEIIWRRSPSHNKLSKQFGPIHDSILFMTKSDDAIFHPGRTPYTRSYIESEFRFKDTRGLYRLNEIMGAGRRGGDSGKSWNSYDPSARGRHWAIPTSLRSMIGAKADKMTVQEQLDALLELGLIVLSKSGRPKYKQYPGSGVYYQDIWAFQPGTSGILYESNQSIDEDVKWLSNEAERLGYPTQKPVGLLERIITSSTDEGAVVLDPFCGCGTTVHAAQHLGRSWIGIDITHIAIQIIEDRLRKYFPTTKPKIIGRPKDLDGAHELAHRDKHEFQSWAVWLAGGWPVGGVEKRGWIAALMASSISSSLLRTRAAQ